ncbi:metallophosphoesterase family protein [Bradyrhizobium guangzhouense]|uniref:metallophosphoesterase family protein n=1 Tax=Bradyrhizobium guangzhouense TaxID=1325095 RepID=UPI0013E8A354|nr:metallophosphoesterase [Bradyrhizobium guangzhouense]
MIRIHVVSDLHDDIKDNKITDWPAGVEADVIVVAGDAMAPGSHALLRIRELYPDRSIPLIYVAGNHDFYSETNPKLLAIDPTLKTTWERERVRMREVARELDIHFLDDDVVVIEVNGEPVRFIGSTLWPSFKARPPWMMFSEAVMDAKKYMRDYTEIKVGRGRGKDKLTPGMTIDAHKRSVAFIEQTLAESFDGQTVAITHMCPSYLSLQGWDPRHPHTFAQLDHCYASSLDHLMQGDNAPALWVHGHVHSSKDYVVGNNGTRVVCNPRGYPEPRHATGRENPNFDPTLVVELEPKYSPDRRP